MATAARTPITLVCAPAGFGKTSLVAHWAGEADVPVAWLTLEPQDGDLGVFLRRVIAAMRAVAPSAGQQTERQLRKRRPVGAMDFAGALLVDLDTVAGDLVLVLDDYSTLPPGPVHEVIDEIVRRLSARKGLILIARRDPPLALQECLVSGRASEIRQGDLAFTDEEARAYFDQQTGSVPTEVQLKKVADRLDGWPAGLHLLAQGLTDANDRDRVMAQLPRGVLQARLYLAATLFDGLTPARQDLLLRCSILVAFDAELCAAVADRGDPGAHDGFPESERTFVKPIEGRRSWFHIRPLFQDFLEDRRHERLDADVVRTIHDRASRWFSAQGQVVRAVDHALLGHEPTSAAGVLADHRIRLINEGRYGELAQAMQRLPADIIDSHLDTRLLRVWMTPSDVFREAVSRVESMLARERPPADRAAAARGELRLMQAGNIMSLSMEDPSGLPELVAHAEEALELLPTGFTGGRATAYHLLAQALQFQGQLHAAEATLDRGVAEFAVGAGHPLSLIHFARALAHIMEADLVTARDAAVASLACKLSVPPETDPYRLQARRLLGLIHFHWNELAEAAEVLEHPEGRAYPESVQLLARVRQAQGKEAEAAELVEATVTGDDRGGGRTNMLYARAHAAQLALRQGRTADALRWAEGARTEEVRPFHSALSTSLIRAEILIRAGEARHRETASRILQSLDQAAQRVHQRKHRIEILALEALLRAAEGDDDGALSALRQSVALAAKGRFVRIYLELGAGMQRLMARFPFPSEYGEYVTSLREAFAEEGSRTSERVKQALPDPLSHRERDVLALMAERLSNKEIAARLHVSVPTVKSHANRIYQKLHVHDRRGAVEKATGLGLLPQV